MKFSYIGIVLFSLLNFKSLAQESASFSPKPPDSQKTISLDIKGAEDKDAVLLFIKQTQKNENSILTSGYYHGNIPNRALDDLIKKGDVKAMFDKALHIYSELRVPLYPQGFMYVQKAARSHLLRAQYLLALFYEKGIGTSQDLSQAAHWYKLAARAGYIDAQYNLAGMYIKGLGVNKDLISALSWLYVAKMRGDVNSNTAITALKSQMSQTQIHQAESIAKHWEIGSDI